MSIKIVKQPITLAEIKGLAEERFGDLVKAVVDVKQQIMAIGGELHADEEALLIENGSEQQDLWGINIYPDKSKEEWIEFDSIINVRPSQDNRSRDVEDPEIRKCIIKIVNRLIRL